jgi:hypothetical protein
MPAVGYTELAVAGRMVVAADIVVDSEEDPEEDKLQVVDVVTDSLRLEPLPVYLRAITHGSIQMVSRLESGVTHTPMKLSGYTSR